jgi:hypothetical protein
VARRLHRVGLLSGRVRDTEWLDCRVAANGERACPGRPP